MVQLLKKPTTEFGVEARSWLNHFKQICRSNQPKLKRCRVNIDDLQIKRQQLRYYNDTELYLVIEEIIKHIESIIHNTQSELYEHKGMAKFIDDLRSMLDCYTIQNNSVIHIGKYSARIHLNLLQNIALLKQNNEPDVEKNILRQIKILTKLQHHDTIQKIRQLIEEIRLQMPRLYKKINLMYQSQ